MTLPVAIFVALTAALTLQPPSTSPSAVTKKGAQDLEHIDGKVEPHRIPPEVAWENLFTVISVVLDGKTGAAEEEGIRALAVHNFGMSPADTRIVADVALKTLAKVTALREPLDREHKTGESLNWSDQQYRERHDEVARTILEARLSIKRKLSTPAFAQLERYVIEKIAPGTQIVRRVAQ